MTTQRLRSIVAAMPLMLAVVLLGCGGSATPPRDTTAPVVTLSGTSTSPVAAPLTLGFAFSEDVGSSFTASDVAITQGSLGSLTKVDATHYAMVVTPPAEATGLMQISIAAGAFSDLTGNANTAAATVTQAYNTITGPSAAPAHPTHLAANVVSLLSDAYTNRTMDTWRTSWSNATLTEVMVGSDHVKKYSALDFVGVESTGANLVDASAMTHLHLDVWTPDATTFRIKLVDFGANGIYGGGDDTEHELAFTASTSPALSTGGWVGIDVPLASFSNLTNRAHLAQYIFSGLPSANCTVFIDNFYFYRNALPTEPSAAPARPTHLAANVVSLLSDAYTNRTMDTWRTSWSNATLTEVMVGSDHVKKYSALDFVGIESTGANLVDASAMTHLHLDVWTPDATTFRLKLVDFGANGIYGGGDDTEHELAFTASTTPALSTGAWVGIDVPLASFTNLTNRAHLAQYIFSALPTANCTVFIDNFYFYKTANATEPTVAPARPTLPAANVISLLSDAYTNRTMDTWRTSWSNATLTEVMVGGDHVKKYSALDFVGIESTGANLVDASTMTHLHLDVWTPDATTFRIKLVDFGANGIYGGGDDTEHELAFTASTTPALTTGGWVSLDIPLSSFTNLTNRAHLAQYIFSALPTANCTAFIANFYFYK